MRLVFIPLIIILFNMAAFSQLKEEVMENALLWRIEKPGANVSYLYGTVHAICKEDLRIPKKVIVALNSCSELYEEILFEKSVPKSATAKASLRDSSYSLKKVIGAKRFKTFVDLIAANIKLPEKYLDNLSPQIAARMVKSFGFPCRTTSYEYELKKLADSAGIRLRALESDSIRREVLFTEKKTKPETALKELIDYSERRGNHDFIEMTNHYYDQNITALYVKAAYGIDGRRTSSSKLLLDKRNQIWIHVIEIAVQKLSCFFAFGAAHLAGKDGVITLLREKGYTVTPVY